MQISLHRILHACFHKFIIYYLVINHTFSQNIIHGNKIAFHVSYKHAYFDTQNICAIQKITIKGIHVSFTRIARL
jgi:hypothetical protein